MLRAAQKKARAADANSIHASAGPTAKEGQESKPALRDRVAEIAYYLAQKRGFQPGGEVDDWYRAEALVESDQIAPEF